jgi:hypothetical protein
MWKRKLSWVTYCFLGDRQTTLKWIEWFDSNKMFCGTLIDEFNRNTALNEYKNERLEMLKSKWEWVK